VRESDVKSNKDEVVRRVREFLKDKIAMKIATERVNYALMHGENGYK